MSQGPLAGLRVLEFSLILAGPFAGMHLADMGADVIKVEPLEGEPRRNSGPVPGTTRIFQWVNRGKRSIQIDLKQPAAREAIHRLVQQMDVVIENYRPGVPKRLGIDYETLSAIKPDLIYVNISGFGSEGPMAGAAAADAAAQAYSGAMAANGKLGPTGAPVGIGGITLGDASAGIGATMGVLAALYHRDRTGEGQYLETSLVHSAMVMEGQTTMRDGWTDEKTREPLLRRFAEIRAAGGTYAELVEARAERGGGGRRGSNYFTGFLAKDGGICISANTVGGRMAVRKVLGLEGAGTDDPALDVNAPDFPEIVKREREEIEHRLAQRTVAEWMADFVAAGAPVAPVLLPEEVSDDPQGTYYFQDLVHSVTGPERQVKPMVTFARTPASIRAAADMPGEHADEVFRDYGFTQAEVDALRSGGMLV